MNLEGKRVFVGLSGGVDSAVTAALMQEAGARVTGVFVKGAYPEGLPCTWADDRRDAMRVAARRGIPFLTLDASAAYQRAVIDYLTQEYAAGRTPNPDVMCNRDVKFGAFYDFATARGADYVATGHYARIESAQVAEYAAPRIASLRRPASRELSVPLPHIPRLLRGIDEAKDQSYFLWAIKREVLPHILFPLGGMEKREVRALARKFNLPNAEKRDSQGICFLGNVSIEDFLRHEVGLVPGSILDEAGKTIGTHAGAIAYTLGERIAVDDAQGAGPWYVVRKDLSANTLTAAKTPAGPKARAAGAIALMQLNWLAEPEAGKPYEAQYRYHGERIRGTLAPDCSSFIPAEPLRELIAPGQSLVVYDGEQLIGGGIIAA